MVHDNQGTTKTCYNVNIITWLEFELAYSDVAIQLIIHYDIGSFQK